MVSNLALDISEGTNPKSFRLIDESQYNTKLPVEDATIEITSPGFTYSKHFHVKPYFNMAFNASLLGIATTKSKKNLIDLPDGLYEIKYSIKPNDKLFVEYTHFRNYRLVEKHHKAVCELFSNRLSFTNFEFAEKRRNLIWIKELILASKYKVEGCGDFNMGMEMYNEANDLLGKCDLNCNI